MILVAILNRNLDEHSFTGEDDPTTEEEALEFDRTQTDVMTTPIACASS